jgi:hypothetical protein
MRTKAASGLYQVRHELYPNESTYVDTSFALGHQEHVTERFGLRKSRHIGTLLLGGSLLRNPGGAQVHVLDTAQEDRSEYGRVTVVSSDYRHGEGGHRQTADHTIVLGSASSPAEMLPVHNIADRHVVIGALRPGKFVHLLYVGNGSHDERTTLQYAAAHVPRIS